MKILSLALPRLLSENLPGILIEHLPNYKGTFVQGESRSQVYLDYAEPQPKVHLYELMKTLDFNIEIYLTVGINYTCWSKEDNKEDDYRVCVSELISDRKSVELTDEQFDLLYKVWSQNGEKPELETLGCGFQDIFDRLTTPHLNAIKQKYKDYGYSEDYTEMMMQKIGASVTPEIENLNRFIDDVVDTKFEDGIIIDILKSGHKRIVGCTDVHIKVFESDAAYIDTRSFRKCRELQEVHLPNVVSIGPGAFSGCLSLHTVELGSKIKVIDKFAFYGCHFLHSVNLPDGIERIEESAFQGCVNLPASLELPDSIIHVGFDAFAYTPADRLSKNLIYSDEEYEVDDTPF